MDKKILYKSVYRKLDLLTPLRYDCGILCESKCCKGGSESGMLLFPGEELMPGNEAFLAITQKDLGGSAVSFAACKGSCPRKLRPLSCRMYPFVPYLDDAGRLSVIPDPRAAYICPLLILEKDYPVDFIFRRRVYEVFRLLIQDEDIKAFLRTLSGVLKDYMRFTGAPSGTAALKGGLRRL